MSPEAPAPSDVRRARWGLHALFLVPTSLIGLAALSGGMVTASHGAGVALWLFAVAYLTWFGCYAVLTTAATAIFRPATAGATLVAHLVAAPLALLVGGGLGIVIYGLGTVRDGITESRREDLVAQVRVREWRLEASPDPAEMSMMLDLPRDGELYLRVYGLTAHGLHRLEGESGPIAVRAGAPQEVRVALRPPVHAYVRPKELASRWKIAVNLSAPGSPRVHVLFDTATTTPRPGAPYAERPLGPPASP